jgi:hypothetical protein
MFVDDLLLQGGFINFGPGGFASFHYLMTKIFSEAGSKKLGPEELAEGLLSSSRSWLFDIDLSWHVVVGLLFIK